MSGSFFYMLQWNPVTVKLTKPWTPEIFMECYCVAKNKPIEREITKPQTATVISLWFWSLLACPKLYCDWQVHNHPRRPRGSQSGREKRRDESFHVRAKALSPVLENFRRAFLDPTDCPWVSEDGTQSTFLKIFRCSRFSEFDSNTYTIKKTHTHTQKVSVLSGSCYRYLNKKNTTLL